MNPVSFSLALLLLFPALRDGVQAQGARTTVVEARVSEVIQFLASDELAGRDTPSPGLDQAADFIAERFRNADLEPLADGRGFFHRYSLPGMSLNSNRIEVTLHMGTGEGIVNRELIANRDVRIWRAGGGFEAERTQVLVSGIEAAGGQRGGLRPAGQRPRILLVSEEDPQWEAADGTRHVLGSRMVGGAPVLLVRREVLGEGPFTATIRVPAPDVVDIPLRNPIGILRGAELPDEFVIVSAHYDHEGIKTPVDGDGIYNGADDNASGTTAVVVLAEALAASDSPPARSIVFVCFSGEEKGLRGSRAFAENPPFPLENVVANVNIEMIGRPSADGRMAAWITGSDLSDFAAIAGPALGRSGIRLTDFEMADDLFFSSDNASLARMGVVAHSISAGTVHEDYHMPSDEVDKLDLEHMTAVIAGIGEMVLEFAQREEKPAYNQKGRRRLRLDRRP